MHNLPKNHIVIDYLAQGMNAYAVRLALLPSSRRPTGKLLLGMVALLLVLWFFPGIRTMLQQSSDAQKH
jgi:hypothetical protein